MSVIPADECGKGLECPVHHRITEHIRKGPCSLIDYLGEFVVHTTEMSQEEVAWALVSGGEMYAARLTVYRVGENGVLNDLLENGKKLKEAQVISMICDYPDDIDETNDEEVFAFMKHDHDRILADLAKFI